MNVQVLNPNRLLVTLPAVADPGGTYTIYLGKLSGANALFTSDAKYQIIGCELNVQTTHAKHASNAWAIKLLKTDGTPVTIAAVNTDSDTAVTWTDSAGGSQTTGVGVDLTAGTPAQFVFSTEKADWMVDADDSLYLTFADTGTPTTLAAGATVVIDYVYGKVA